MKKRIDSALMDVDTAASFLGISPRALRARIARRQVPFRKFHGRVVLIRWELEEFVDQLDGCRLKDVQSKMGD